MKLKQMAAVAALAVGTAACNAATPVAGLADTNDTNKTAQAQGTDVTSARAVGEAISTTSSSEDDPKPTNGPLGPDYKTIESFVAFRKKLLADGWRPVINPKCRDAVLGADYDNFCKAHPEKISCRVCEMVPEIMRHTSDGYNVMHYIKDGIPLSVTTYGDIRSIDQPGIYELIVVGWEYTTNVNAILID